MKLLRRQVGPAYVLLIFCTSYFCVGCGTFDCQSPSVQSSGVQQQARSVAESDPVAIPTGRAAAFIFSGTMEATSDRDGGPSHELSCAFDFAFSKVYWTPIIWLNHLSPLFPHSVQSDDGVQEAVALAQKAWKDGDDIVLFGWSRGGMLAIETARQLKVRGVNVRYVGLIDPVSTYLKDYSAEIPGNVEHVGIIYKTKEDEGLLTTRKVTIDRAIPSSRVNIYLSDLSHANGPSSESFGDLLNDANDAGVKLAQSPGESK